MGNVSRKTKEHTFEVAISFDGLNQGERFSQVPDAWSDRHTDTGYLKDVTGEPTAAEAQGEQAPEAAPERVEEAHSGSQERQG